MATKELSWEEKCENMMNVVVESRKRYGKMSVDYDQKCNLMESKMLNLQIAMIENHNFKSKIASPQINVEEFTKDNEEFTCEVLKIQRKKENLKQQLKSMENIVAQLKKDKLNKKAREPFTAEVFLNRVKSKGSQK